MSVEAAGAGRLRVAFTGLYFCRGAEWLLGFGKVGPAGGAGVPASTAADRLNDLSLGGRWDPVARGRRPMHAWRPCFFGMGSIPGGFNPGWDSLPPLPRKSCP